MAMSVQTPITVLGAGGWIGSSLVRYLRGQGHDVKPIDRDGLSDWLNDCKDPGYVFYTIGLTSDFRKYPHETVVAHVSLLSRVLQCSRVKQLLYLSSTRVYARSTDTRETAALPCLSTDPSDLYNLSKLMGESLVLSDPRPELKVVRLSNVVGHNQPTSTFLGELLHDARATQAACIQQPPEMAKDYVSLDDVLRLLHLIAMHGRHRLYNVASGKNVCHSQVADMLGLHDVAVSFKKSTNEGLTFAQLSIDRLKAEFVPPGDPFSNFFSHHLSIP